MIFSQCLTAGIWVVAKKYKRKYLQNFHFRFMWAVFAGEEEAVAARGN